MDSLLILPVLTVFQWRCHFAWSNYTKILPYRYVILKMSKYYHSYHVIVILAVVDVVVVMAVVLLCRLLNLQHFRYHKYRR